MKKTNQETKTTRTTKKPNRAIKATKKFIAVLLTLGVVGYSAKTAYEVSKDNAMGTAIVNEINNNNPELISRYNNYVQAVANTIRSTKDGILNPVEAYSAYLILQSNGYLSNNKEFSYNKPIMFEVPGHLGMSVPLGSANARNTVCNLNEVMKALGFDSTVQLGYVFNGLNKEYNAACVAVTYAGITYVFDPYNHQVYLKDAIIQFKAVDNPNLRFIPSEKLDKQYGPELTADTIEPLHKWQPGDYKNYSAIVKEYIHKSGKYYPKIPRSLIDDHYNNEIEPALDSYIDELLLNYYVDDASALAYMNGFTPWPGKYLAQTSEGLISSSFIDEHEAQALSR